MKPRRPNDMALARYDWLVERWLSLCAVTGVSPEDAEAEMHKAGFFDDWELRLDRMSENEDLAAHCQRALLVGIAEGDPDAIALSQTPEGKANLARRFRSRGHCAAFPSPA